LGLRFVLVLATARLAMAAGLLVVRFPVLGRPATNPAPGHLVTTLGPDHLATTLAPGHLVTTLGPDHLATTLAPGHVATTPAAADLDQALLANELAAGQQQAMLLGSFHLAVKTQRYRDAHLVVIHRAVIHRAAMVSDIGSHPSGSVDH